MVHMNNKRIYRRRDELPHPELSHGHEQNRTKKLISWRVDPKLLVLINRAAKDAGITRTAWLEEAVKMRLVGGRSQGRR